jgi:hypothetical protein
MMCTGRGWLEDERGFLVWRGLDLDTRRGERARA